jgi:SAM-dependent methyltransferase
MSASAAPADSPIEEQRSSPTQRTPEPDYSAAADIEAESLEHEEDDADSAVGDDLQSFTTSLKSSVLNYRYENGRRYHGFKDEAYFFPNDDEENDRLDMYHHIITLRCNGELHLAPIGPNPQRMLDLGTGTGIWAIDMGDKYPSAEIIGNDISPIQPSLVPPNVRFEIDDMEKTWVYANKFDYIHCRAMAGSLRDWPKLLRQAYQFTKPGGYVEFQDFDLGWYAAPGGEFEKGCPIDEWIMKIGEGLRKFGLDPSPGANLKTWVEEAGFVNVKERPLPIPTGTWPKDQRMKEIGAFDLISFLDNLEGLTMRVYNHAFGWTADEVKVLCAQVRKDLKNPRLRLVHNFYAVYGQKPEDAV